jgi:hypothetical protein
MISVVVRRLLQRLLQSRRVLLLQGGVPQQQMVLLQVQHSTLSRQPSPTLSEQVVFCVSHSCHLSKQVHLTHNQSLLVVSSSKRIVELGLLQQIGSMLTPCKQNIRHIRIHSVFFSCLVVINSSLRFGDFMARCNATTAHSWRRA